MQPKLEVTKQGEDSDLEFTVELEVLPEITIPELTDITLTKLVAPVEDAAVDDALGKLTEQRKSFEPVEEARGAVAGEQLTVDFIGRIGDEAFQGGTANDVPVIVAGEGFIPGFTEQLEGLSPGESRTISVTFPAEYQAAELAGKDATFMIEVQDIFCVLFTLAST